MRMRFRPGLTAVEMILALGLLSMATGFIIPAYRDYIGRSDLELARQRVAQGIERAKFLAEVGMNDSAWGFAIDNNPSTPHELRGVIFMGSSYALRDALYDEYYPIPATIDATGMDEIVFEKITGRPLTTVENNVLTLTTEITGDERIITVSVGDDGNVSTPDDWLEICVNANQTIRAPDSLWEYYEEQGATIGACGSGVASSASASSAASGGGVPIDPDDWEDGKVTPTEDFDCTITVLGAAIESSGEDLPVTLDFHVGSNGEEQPFGNPDLPVNSNLNDGQQHTANCANPPYDDLDKTIYFRAISWEKRRNDYSGAQNSHWRENLEVESGVAEHHSNNVVVLRNGDDVPPQTGAYSQASVEQFLQGYINYGVSPPRIQLGVSQYIYLFELGTVNQNSSAFDLQDLVVLLTVEGAL